MWLSRSSWDLPLNSFDRGRSAGPAFLVLVLLVLGAWCASLSVVHTSPEALWGVVLSGVCLVVFFLALVRLDIACCVFLLFMPVQLVTFWPLFANLGGDERIPASHCVLAALIVGAVFNRLARVEGRPLRIRRPLLVLILWALAGLVWSPNLNNALLHLTILAGSLGAYHVAYLAAGDRSALERMMTCWTVAAVIAVVVGAVTVWVDSFVFHEYPYPNWRISILNRSTYGGRAGGIAPPLQVAYISYLALFLTLPRLFDRPKPWHFLLVFLLLLGVKLSEKRAAHMATLGAFLVFVFLVPRLRPHLPKLFLGLVLLSVAVMQAGDFLTGRWGYGRYAQAFSTSSGGLGIESRLDAYGKNIKRNFKHFFGMGMGVGGSNLLLWRSGTPIYEHSLYFSAFNDLGPFGFAVLMFFWVRETRRIMRRISQTADRRTQLLGAAFVAGIAAIAAHGMLDLNYYFFYEIWFFLGLASAYLDLSSREAKRLEGEAPLPHPAPAVSEA